MWRQLNFDLISFIIVIPVILPLLFSCINLALRGYAHFSMIFSLIGFFLQLIFSGIIFALVLSDGTMSMTMGSWVAPFGISFVADIFAAMLCFTSNLICVLVFIYCIGEVKSSDRQYGFFSLLFLLLAGVNGAFLTGDIFNLYVWFEVILISSLGLLVYGGGAKRFDSGIKYSILNLLATTFFLVSIALLYGLTGTLNFASLSLLTKSGFDYGYTGYLFIFSLGIKSAIFPLFFWLPASYHVPYHSVSAIFAALLTKVGVYSLYRIYTIFLYNMDFQLDILLYIGILTLFSGSFLSISERNLRRQFGFIVISGVGMILLSLGLNTPTSFLAGNFYFIHSMLTMCSLYFLCGLLGKSDLIVGRDYGYGYLMPYTSFLCLIIFFCASGLPPFSGFWSKIILLRELWLQEQFIIAFVVLLSSFFVMLGLMRSYVLLFWRYSSADTLASSADISVDNTSAIMVKKASFSSDFPVGSDKNNVANVSSFIFCCRYIILLFLVSCLVLIGLFPDIVGIISDQSANLLHSRLEYIASVSPVTDLNSLNFEELIKKDNMPKGSAP